MIGIRSKVGQCPHCVNNSGIDVRCLVVRSQVEEFMDLDWKRSFKLKLEKREVLGLDIGSSAVKIIQLRKDGADYTVTAAGIADIAAGENSSDLIEVNTVGAICKCLESTGIQTRLAVCSICGPEVAVRDFGFPLLQPEEIEGAVLLEAGQVCPFNVDDASVDYQLIPDGDGKISGVLVAATNKVLKRKIQFVEEASLNCVLMDVDALALLNCFSECEKPEAGQTTTILNVGSSYTSLAIMGNNNLPFVRDMAYAGKDIIKQIASENNLSTEAVGKILFIGESADHPQFELTDSLARACQKLIVDVSETLRYYTAQQKSAVVDNVFVCGSFALVKGFIELLDSQLPARAVLWNPFDKMRCDAGQPCRDILAKRGPAMAVAAGLAMRSI
jgi:type IV pilus assembly protein PilM